MYSTSNYQITVIIINTQRYCTKDKIIDERINIGINFLVWLLIFLITHHNEVIQVFKTIFS